jgi:hypothetical protein
MVLKVFKKPLAIAEILRNIAEVIFASAFIGQILSKEVHFWGGLLGLLVAITIWCASLYLEKE